MTADARPRLYVIQLPDYSGAELLQIPVMRADDRPLLACPAGSRVEGLARTNGIDTVDLPFRSLRHSAGWRNTLRSGLRGLTSAADLRRVVRAHPEREIIYGTSLRPGLLASLAAGGLKRKTVWVITDYLPPAPLRQLIRVLARVARPVIVAHSDILARDFAGRSEGLRRWTNVIHPGVELERFSSDGVEPGKPLAGLLGHISPVKRTDLAVEIARRVSLARPTFRLDVYGRAQFRPSDFAFAERLEREVADDAQLRDHVFFRGHVGDVPAALRDLGLLLHCCEIEGFGMAIVEAMACGLPVVAPASGGPLEIVEDGVTGLLYSPGDAAQAAAQVIRLLDDRGLAQRLGRAGRLAVEQRFVVTTHVAALERALGGDSA